MDQDAVLAPTEAWEEQPGDNSVQVTNWPPAFADMPYEMVTLPSGTQVRVDRHVSYGELLLSSLITLLLVVTVGRWLWERIRGVM